MTKKPENKAVQIFKETYGWIIVWALTALVIVMIFYFYNFNNGLSKLNSDWGTFGDYFGGILNPIFAFLGLIALLLTLRIQSRELSNSTKELKNSATALKAQGKLLNKQNFENTFFQMVKLHNDIVNSIDLHKTQGGELIAEGRDCFKNFYKKKLESEYWMTKRATSGVSEYKRINLAYSDFYDEHQQDLGHYFRNLYTIFKFIDESNSEDKKLYIRIIRAQLSSFELGLLFYNCLHDVSSDKFKLLIEKHHILQNFDTSLLFDPENHSTLYNESAYT